jgi:hypothetical protein
MNNIRKSFRSDESAMARAGKPIFALLDEIYEFMLKHMVEVGPSGINEPFDSTNGYFDVQIFGGYAMYRNLQLLANHDGIQYIKYRMLEPIRTKIAKLEDIKSRAGASTPSKIKRVNRQLGQTNTELATMLSNQQVMESQALAVQERFRHLLYLFEHTMLITTKDIDFKVFTKDKYLKNANPGIISMLEQVKPQMDTYFRTLMTDTLNVISDDILFNNNRHKKYYKILKAGAVDIAFMVDRKIASLEIYERFFKEQNPSTPFNGTYPGLTDNTMPISTMEDAELVPIVPGIAAIPLMWANQTHLAVLAIAGVLTGKYTNKNKALSKVVGRLLIANAMYYPHYDYRVVYSYLDYIDWMNTAHRFDKVMKDSVARSATDTDKENAAKLARELVQRYVDYIIFSPEQIRLAEMIIDEDDEFRRDLDLSDVDIARVKGTLMLSRFSGVHAQNDPAPQASGARPVATQKATQKATGSSNRRSMKPRK